MTTAAERHLVLRGIVVGHERVSDVGTYNNVGGALSSLQGQITDLSGLTDAVVYDTSAHNSVTLGGAGASHAPVVLKNVATGVDPTDAVNVAQLKQQVITGNPYIAG